MRLLPTVLAARAALAGIFAAIALPALAADLSGPLRDVASDDTSPPRVVWSGIHFGVHGGMDLSSTKLSVPGAGSLDSLGGNGGAYGIHAGIDHQIAGTVLVLGIGGDYTWSDSDFRVNVTGLPTALRAGIDESWAAWGRVGIDTGRVMPYVLAGYSEADASASVLGTSLGSVTMSGWLAGGGFEWAMSNGVFLGAEYRFTKFDTEKLVPGVVHLDTERHEVRAALKYRFNPF